MKELIVKNEIIITSGKIVFCLFFILGSFSLIAQENPPIPISIKVDVKRYLDFGAFTVGDSGGKISVDHSGIKTAHGDVVPLNLGSTVTAALYEITANPGTIVTIVHPENIVLESNNGQQILLNINSYSTGKTFITTAPSTATNSVYIGGTLTIGNISANPAGRYNGQMTITFIQQ